MKTLQEIEQEIYRIKQRLALINVHCAARERLFRELQRAEAERARMAAETA